MEIQKYKTEPSQRRGCKRSCDQYSIMFYCTANVLEYTEYTEGVNEFEKTSFSMMKSDLIRPFREAKSPIQIECRVSEIKPLGKGRWAGNLVICEVLKLHTSNAVMTDFNSIDQEKLDLVARGGGSYYIRAI